MESGIAAPHHRANHPMTPLQLAYDFETPMEKALALALGACLIATYTPTNEGFVDAAWQAANPELEDYVLSAVTFLKKRPRVEAVARIGAAQGRHWPETTELPASGGYLHDQGRALSVGLKIITGVNILEHRQYVAQVRGLMATILRTINGDTIPDVPLPEGGQLTLFRIPELAEAGASSAYKNEEGFFTTDIVYAGQITTLVDTLTALNQ